MHRIARLSKQRLQHPQNKAPPAGRNVDGIHLSKKEPLEPKKFMRLFSYI